MTETPSPSARQYLVVVRPDRPDVYERLSAIGAPGVDLFWDRRHRERRAAQAAVSGERRTRERRRPPPPTWAILGFVIGHRQGAPG